MAATACNQDADEILSPPWQTNGPAPHRVLNVTALRERSDLLESKLKASERRVEWYQQLYNDEYHRANEQAERAAALIRQIEALRTELDLVSMRLFEVEDERDSLGETLDRMVKALTYDGDEYEVVW